MRVILLTLNATYMHSALALRCLEAVARKPGIDVCRMEYTINDDLRVVLAALVEAEPEIVAIQGTIWNIEPTLRLCRMIERTLPGVRLVLGGPEVSYDAVELLRKEPAVEAVVVGEGEATFVDLLEHEFWGGLPGVVCRSPNGFVVGEPRTPLQSTEWPDPYCDGLDELRGRIAYVEGSRGCPFACAFCLSAREGHPRLLAEDELLRRVDTLLEAGVQEIRFVDRTWNWDRRRARRLWKELFSRATSVPLHFEIVAELLEDEDFELLVGALAGQFHFEIGIQSTNPRVNQNIRRVGDWSKTKVAIHRLRSETMVHLHLDLIVGLPGEDWASCRTSINHVLELQPHQLQLGFLKLLKGTELRERADELGLVAAPDPPYEVLRTEQLSAKELARLHRIEDLVERIYNSGYFPTVWARLMRVQTPFDLLLALEEFWVEQGYHRMGHGLPAVFDRMAEFLAEHCPPARVELWYDYCRQDRAYRHPDWVPDFPERTQWTQLVRERIHQEHWMECYLPELARIPRAERKKQHTRIEAFPWSPGQPDKGPQVGIFHFGRPIRGERFAQVWWIPVEQLELSKT